MSPENLSRRALVAGVASVPALAIPASADEPVDAELRGLWSEYLAVLAADEVSDTNYQRARAAYDAEEPPCPEGVLLGHHFENCRWLWRKHRLDELTDKCTSTDAAIRLTVAAILRARPQSLFGIAVKLSALPLHAEDDAQDSFETIGSVLEDIDRLVGSTFGTRFAEKYEVVPLNRDWQPEPEESGRLIVLS
jgi:hypothetical protein